MHAAVGVFKMDPRLFARQRRELDERIVPFVRHQPGFVSATWSYDRDAGRSYAFVVLDSESAARKLVAFVEEQSSLPNDAGVELESVIVAEVLAEARK